MQRKSHNIRFKINIKFQKQILVYIPPKKNFMNTTKLHHETFEKIKIYHNFERNQIYETEKTFHAQLPKNDYLRPDLRF